MGEIILDKQSEPATPSSGDAILFIDTNDTLKMKKDDGVVIAIGSSAAFPYRVILSNETVIIPARQEMIITDTLDLQGTIDVVGFLTILP